MTINEIAYMCLEILRGGNVVDDERMDIRLIKDWIDLKRAQYIKNDMNTNPNNRINLNLYQTLPVVIAADIVEDAGDYPFANSTTQSYEIIESTTTIPAILEGKNGPLIYSLESQDKMKLPFSIVDYDYMRFAGNGKFNQGIIFGSLRDNKIYFKYNSLFETYTNVVLRAIFENPRDITGFVDDTSEYPANLGLIEYIKNGVMDLDFRMFLVARSDENNDATGEIK